MADERRPPSDPREPFVVDPERTRDERRSRAPVAALGVVAVVVAGLSAWGLLTPPAPAPSRVAPTAGPTGGTATGRPSAGASGGAAAQRDDDVILAELAAVAGWLDCPVWRGFGVGAEVGPETVDAERRRQGVVSGRLEVGDQLGGTVTVWLSGDAEAAVEGLGGREAVEDGDAVWTLIASEPASGAATSVAVRLARSELADGTVYWQERARAGPAPYCVGDRVPRPPATVIEVDPGEDALRRVFVETGMDVCRTWQRLEAADHPSGAEMDLAADQLGLDVAASGWILLPAQPGYGQVQTRTWVGTDPALAGAEHGSDLVVLAGPGASEDAGGIAWMRVRLDGRPAAIQLLVVDTPAGRRAWLPTPNAAGVIGACRSDIESPAADQQPGDERSSDASPNAEQGPTVELLRGGDGALEMLIGHFGWAGCRMVGSGGTAEPPPPELVGRVARAVDASVPAAGWVAVAPGEDQDRIRAWIGDDLVALARANEVEVVAVDGSATVWLADATRAAAWRAIVTPAGRTAWYPTGAVLAPDGPCPGTIGEPETIDGLRSFTCWTDRARCLEAVRAAIYAAPDAFPPGAEVAAGLGDSCEPGTRCPWVGPNMPITVTAAPPGWTSSGDVRAFSAGWRRLPQPFREVAPAEIGPGVLTMASRPSRALPVAPPGHPGAVYCPASGITGVLRGSPWDPRVAWVGLSTVRWPEGFTARFTPALELLAPGGARYAAGDRLQVSGLAGDEPVFEACAVAGTTRP